MPGGIYPPPEVIASWPKPNYVDPETRGPALTITCTVMTAIGVIAVAARLYARLFITRAAGIDDAIIGVALLLAIGSSVLNVYGAEALYVGYHNWDIPVSDFTRTRLNSWCAQWLYSGALSAVKISLLLFYRRLSGPFSRFFLWATWIGITYNLLSLLAVPFSLILECRPTNAYWLEFDPTWVAEGHTYHCAHFEGTILPLYSALSVIGDAYSTTLPLCLVYSLKMGRRQSMSLCGLFALGYLVVAAGIVRTIFINETMNKTYDTSWRYYDSLLWINVELYTAIVCASAPGLKPFVERFLVEPITRNTSSRNQGRSGYALRSSGKRRDYAMNPGDPYLNDTNNDEEMWDRHSPESEFNDFEKQNKNVGVAVHEMSEFFNDLPRHSLISNRLKSGLEQRLRTKQFPTDRNSHTGQETVLEPPQILDNRTSPHPGELVPFRFMPSPVHAGFSPTHTRASSFVTISAFPVPQVRAPSRISETDEKATEGNESVFKLPLQGTRENSPVDMKPIRTNRQHIAHQHKHSVCNDL